MIKEHARSQLGGVHMLPPMNINLMLCMVIAVLSIFACTKQESNKVSATSPAQAPASAAAMPSQTSTGSLQVKMLPETPTVTSDIQVVFSCTGNATYEWRRNNQIIGGETTDWLSKKQFVKGDDITATVKCDSSEGTAMVTIANSPPRVLSVPFSPDDIHAGVDITVKPAGYDPDGDDVGFMYKWSVNGNEISNNSSMLSRDRFKRGDKVLLTVIPYDREGSGPSFVSQNMVIPNGAPRILSSPPQEIHGEVYTYRVTAEDPDGDPITFSLLSAPSGMTIDSNTGVISWPITPEASGNYEVELAAQDPGGLKTTQKYTFSIPYAGGGPR